MGLKGKLPDFVSIIFNLKENLKKKKKISFSDSFEQIIIEYYMAFFILPLLSARDLDIGPEVRYQSRTDDKGNMKKAMY